MGFSAAAATSGDPAEGWAILAFAGAVWLAGYLVACRFWPFKACRKCGGAGKLRSPSGRAWRKCPRCKGTTGRLRWGRYLINWAQKAKGEVGKK